MHKIRRVAVRLGYPTESKRPVGDKKYATIEVTDEDSGLAVLTVDLEPRQLFELMAGAIAYGAAEMTEHPGKVGKVMIFREIDLDKLGYQITSRDTSTSPVIRGAISAAHADGWESVRYHIHHGGHFLRCRKWVDFDPETHGKDED